MQPVVWRLSAQGRLLFLLYISLITNLTLATGFHADADSQEDPETVTKDLSVPDQISGTQTHMNYESR